MLPFTLKKESSYKFILWSSWFLVSHNFDSHHAIFLSHGHPNVLSVIIFRKTKAHLNECDDIVSHFRLLTHAFRTKKTRNQYRMLVGTHFSVSNF